MAIAACCAVNYSCTSDFEDEAVVPTAKRTTAQTWSPEVLQRARELGIIIVDEDRQWNNLTDEDVIFYLNLLTEKGDSAFTPAFAPAPKPMGMLRRMSNYTIEDVGSTVHDRTWLIQNEDIGDELKLTVSISWNLKEGKTDDIRSFYRIWYTGTYWESCHVSVTPSFTAKGDQVAYRLKGQVLLERFSSGSEKDEVMEYKIVSIDINGNTSI